MKNTIRGTLMLVAPLAFYAACSSGKSTQPIQGRLDQSTFEAPVTSVRAVRPGATPIVGQVQADGSFALTLTRGKGYRLELQSGSTAPWLVFPRKSGVIESAFDVRGGGKAFDLGLVRRVGDPQTLKVAFLIPATTAVRSPLTSEADAGPSTPAQKEDVDCDDGRDKKTGAVCVDDDDENDNDNNQCGPDDHKAGAAAADKTTLPAQAAVADHNLPSAIGSCDDDDDGEQEDDDDKGAGKGKEKD